ncbi:hypothetical protein [Caballeronia grimmiae]|uniref:hypothetical protein n=1 Tax=Caballeronia grimmiae TaxID=1071679 RepID=UPI0038BCDA60
MSQTRGGNAGYRAKPNSRRQPHHVATQNRAARGQPSSRASESGPAQAASIIKTRSLKFLVDAVGAENIALGLESSLARVAELMRGERFTPETAFHMETTLGLPSGFFDQHHPVLSPEMIARLKSPLEFAHTSATSDEVDVREAPTASDTQNRPLLMSSLPEKMNMRSKSSKDAPGAAKTRSADVAKQVSGHAPAAGSPPRQNRSRQAAEQGHARSDGGAGVERIRRANLHVLTSRNGSKVKLGAVMGLSGSNMAHRLHGKKRMDDAEAERFTERLGLPRGWLDEPRSEAEIPESVILLLAPASRAQLRGQASAPSAAVGDDGAPGAALLRSTDSTLPSITHDEPVVASTTDALGENDGRTSGPHQEVSAVAASADESVEQTTGEVPVVVAAAVASPAAPATSQQTATSSISVLKTSLEGLDGIAPIAEALLKTLAGKARTGRLDELKALELLQQAVLL